MNKLRLLVFSGLLLVAASAPAPAPAANSQLTNGPEIIEIIAPIGIAQETLESLNLGEPNAELSERNKRTIGILRQLFPGLSQIIEQKVQQIVSFVFQTFGSTLLRGALGGGGGNTGGGGGSTSVSLPTFGSDDDDDDDDDDNDDDDNSSSDTDSNTADTSLSSRVGSESSTGDQVQESSTSESESASETTKSTLTDDDGNDLDTPFKEDTSSKDEQSTVTATADAKESDDDDSLVDAESQVNEVRVQFNEQPETKAEAKSDSTDQDSAASGGNVGAIDDLTLDDNDSDSNDENRNKRFLNFGGGDSNSGSGGGSGNFLFDIIRRPAENMARAAGQAFRILTGTDSIGLGITATHTATRDIQPPGSSQLIAGSGGTEQADESANTSDGESVGKGDGYTEGIPGPVTRLLILANRGLSNLVQDLILRLAQTSERIVNFKARLITSII